MSSHLALTSVKKCGTSYLFFFVSSRICLMRSTIQHIFLAKYRSPLTGVLYDLKFTKKNVNSWGTIINTCASASNLQPACAVQGCIMAFLNDSKTREEYFLKIKSLFLVKNVSPQVEFNCCVSDEHAFDFNVGKGFFITRCVPVSAAAAHHLVSCDD